MLSIQNNYINFQRDMEKTTPVSCIFHANIICQCLMSATPEKSQSADDTLVKAGLCELKHRVNRCKRLPKPYLT